jgi:hypothetical protein
VQFSADETIPVEAAYFVAGVDIEQYAASTGIVSSAENCTLYPSNSSSAALRGSN